MKRFINAFLYGLIFIIFSCILALILYAIPYFIEGTGEMNPFHWGIASKIVGSILFIAFLRFFCIIIVFAFIAIITANDEFDKL